MRKLLAAASPYRRFQLGVTFILTLAGAVAELVTIGAVLPLLAVAANPSALDSLPIVGGLLLALSTALGTSAIIAAALFLAVAAVTATAIRLLLSWALQKFVYGLQQDVTMVVFARALRQPYSWFVRQHSSALIVGLEKIYLVIVGIVSPLLLAATSAIIALCIIVLLFFLDPASALIASLSIGVIYVAISVAAKSRAAVVSQALAEVRAARVMTMQDTLGGIRDIILDQSHPLFEHRFNQLEDRLRRNLVSANLLGMVPRLVVEGIVILLIAGLAMWFSAQPGGVLAAIPVLGALALGAQRLLPLVQSIYLGWAGWSIHADSLGDVIALLEAPIDDVAERAPAEPVVPFRHSIELSQLSFAYAAGKNVLADIDFRIARGERIGFIGKTGSGKSTLVDVLMGLLPPSSGQLLVDGEPIGRANLANWKSQIAHVPQAIFLADDSIAANIAFGQPSESLDLPRVERAAAEAGLTEFLDQLPDRLATTVGERGVRLSGGQRQRIGIARALYKQATVLVLDEATSALDDETEAAVMSAVAGLDQQLTIIMIAHRLSTVASCDRIYRLDGGRVVDQGKFADVASKAGSRP